MRAIHAFAFVAVLLPYPNAEGRNWLVGGRWVPVASPCIGRLFGGSVLSQGMVFSEGQMLVLALPIVRYNAAYQIDGTNVSVRLRALSNGNKLVLLFHELDDKHMRDVNGYIYRRCLDLTQGGPTS